MIPQRDPRHHGQTFYWPGAWRGQVEYNADPQHCNRVKVRVWTLHGGKDAIPTEALPWAYVVAPFGGAGGYGEVNPLPVGSRVWVVFEHGDVEKPVVLGAEWGVPPEEQEIGRRNLLPKGRVSMSPDEETPWKSDAGVEIPDEARLRPNMAPEAWVRRTPKGHALVMEDRDGAERLALIDRGGQGLFMEAPVLEEENVGNAARRRLGSADDAIPIDLDKLLAGLGRVELADAAGNLLRLWAKRGSERVSLVSKSAAGDVRIDLASADGRAEIRAGGTSIGLDAVSGGAWIRAKSGDEVRADAGGGVSVRTDALAIDGDLVVGGSVISSGPNVSAGSASGGPGSFAPVSMPTPAPSPPNPSGEVSVEALAKDRRIATDGDDGAVFTPSFPILLPASYLPGQQPVVLLTRNGVDQDQDVLDTLFLDAEGISFDTLGRPVDAAPSLDTLTPDPAYGYSLDGDVWYVGETPDYADYPTGDTAAPSGTRGFIQAERPDDQVIVRGLGRSSGLLLGAEVENLDGARAADWTLVVRFVDGLAPAASAVANFLTEWMLAHPGTFGTSGDAPAFPIHLSADPDGFFWVSLPADGDEVPMWKVSPSTARAVDLVMLASGSTRARRVSVAIQTDFWVSPAKVHLVRPLKADEWVRLAYQTPVIKEVA